ncbi:hypothetical protein OIE66_40525 [Nonomuraea sp. NBC_01738]|uniref:hypothetical protein n=1 Tax=Nonomuraea sp. NBC_01738 TaxID=2976003 RepID=UPI002E140B61|nr:hypothetical protein OIE66_40525 [Nonomuraea sp. NBC_01738]
MPPAKRKPPLPPVPGVEKAPEQLCPACFPAGLDGTPEGATVISCAHGAWQVEDLAAEKPQTPPAVTPTTEDPPADPGKQEPETPAGAQTPAQSEGDAQP